jgi:hypothetical protein
VPLNALLALNSPLWRLKQRSNKIRVFLLSGACGKKDFSYNAHPVPMKNFIFQTSIRRAGIAQLVEHDLAKVGVASSSLVSRSKFNNAADVA